MIGDVLKAKHKLKKEVIVNKDKLAAILKWMKSKESSSMAVDVLIKKVTNELLGDKYIPEDINDLTEKFCKSATNRVRSLEKVLNLLSTRPHTKSGSNFHKIAHDQNALVAVRTYMTNLRQQCKLLDKFHPIRI